MIAVTKYEYNNNRIMIRKEKKKIDFYIHDSDNTTDKSIL